MKVAFSREVKFTPKWNDNETLPENEQVKVLLRPLEMGDLVTLMDSLQTLSGGEIDPESLTAMGDTKNIDQVKMLLEACGHLIPKNTTIDNLEDASGPVTSKDVVKYPYYMELTAELLTELAGISMPTEVEEKNQ